MLIVCLGFTTGSAILTYCYVFQRISYTELANKVGYEGELNLQDTSPAKDILFSPKSSVT